MPITHISPNFNDRPEGGVVKYLILHYTGMATGQAALDRLCDPTSGVSAHYVVEEDGQIFSLVSEEKRAWHAGVSSWEDDKDINGLSIGIELVNPGHDSSGYIGDYRPFPEAQMIALRKLCQEIIARHPIKPCHILGHSDIAPDRKCDPGELLDWAKLSAWGIGLWPSPPESESGPELRLGQKVAPSTSKIDDVVEFQKKLADYGYNIDITGHMDQQTEAVIGAFQRHFSPSLINGIMDVECAALLDNLLNKKQS